MQEGRGGGERKDEGKSMREGLVINPGQTQCEATFDPNSLFFSPIHQFFFMF